MSTLVQGNPTTPVGISGYECQNHTAEVWVHPFSSVAKYFRGFKTRFITNYRISIDPLPGKSLLAPHCGEALSKHSMSESCPWGHRKLSTSGHVQEIGSHECLCFSCHS